MPGKIHLHIYLMFSVYNSFHQISQSIKIYIAPLQDTYSEAIVQYGRQRNYILPDFTGLEI